MAKVVGVPSYQHRLKDMFAVAFLCVVAATSAVLIALLIRGLVSGDLHLRRRAGYGPLAGIVTTLGLAYAARGPWQRLKNGQLEEVVDRPLTVMTSDHTVFCGRPWENVERHRRADDPLTKAPRSLSMDDVKKFRVTENGIEVGSQSPDRVVVGPSGVNLVFVSDVPLQGRDLSLTPLPAEGRALGEALSYFLEHMPGCTAFDPSTFEVRTFLAFPADKLVVDLSESPEVAKGLSQLGRMIATAPARLGAKEKEALEFGLRLQCGDGL